MRSTRFPASVPSGSRVVRLVTTVALGLTTAACGGNAAGSSQGGREGRSAASYLPDSVDVRVLGVLDGEEITAEDLDQSARLRLARFKAEYHNQAHAFLHEAVAQVARDRLVEKAAQDKGMSLNEFYLDEIGVDEVTDETLQSIYEANREQMGGRPLEEIATDLRQQIANQRLQREIDLLGNQYLSEADWTSHVPPYRMEIETEGHASLGPDEAPVTLVVFSDFECPYCKRFNGTLEQIREHVDYQEQVRIVFRHYPLRSIHPDAQKAAEAAICAQDQDQFWPYHDALWTNPDLKVEKLTEHARLLGLDAEAFDTCLISGRHYERVQADYDAALELGQSSTPSVYLNGRLVGGAVSFEQLSQQIDLEIEESSD